METLERTRADRIAALNDRVRQNIDRNARIVFTHGCLATFDDGNAATAIRTQAMILKAIRSHDFGDDDTHSERDFGAFDFRGHRLLFKIDYYDSNLEFGSEDPSDAAQTRRVMTIMLASDY